MVLSHSSLHFAIIRTRQDRNDSGRSHQLITEAHKVLSWVRMCRVCKIKPLIQTAITFK